MYKRNNFRETMENFKGRFEKNSRTKGRYLKKICITGEILK